ncbi:hypothetical protein V6N13_054038 [Hibiscus sabdariffa]
MYTMQEDPIVEPEAQGQRVVPTVTPPVSPLRQPVTNVPAGSDPKASKSKQAIPIRNPLTLSHGHARLRTPVASESSRQFQRQQASGRSISMAHILPQTEPPDPSSHEEQSNKNVTFNSDSLECDQDMDTCIETDILEGSDAAMEAYRAFFFFHYFNGP